MNRRGFSIIVTMLLVLSSLAVIDITMDIMPKAGAITIYVDNDYGSEDATHKKTIQAAVDNASDGDTVFIFNGTYRENIIINKTLNIIGEDNFNTKINGMEQVGIFIENANYVNITNIYVYNASIGIHVQSSYNCNFSNNRVYGFRGEDHVGHGDDGGTGIHIEYSSVFISVCSIFGGDGGTGTYEGGILLSSYGGNGGHGIYAMNSSLNLSQNNIYGGDGGDAEEAFEWSWGGDGGSGIYLEGDSYLNAINTDFNGGFGGQGHHFGGDGGNGIYGEDSYSKAVGCEIIGGASGFGAGFYGIPGFALYCLDSSSNVVNCTLFGEVFNPPFFYFNDNAFYLKGYSNAIALNSDLNKTKVYFRDTLPTLKVQWYLHVDTMDNLAQSIPNAIVCIKDFRNSLPAQKHKTDSEGWARWIVVTEYVEKDTNGDTIGEKTYYTPHKITAWNETLMGYTEVNMNVSKEANVVLDIPSYEIPLYKGWNQISFPLVQSDTSIYSVLSSIAGNYDVVQWYNASDGRWHTTDDDLTDLDHTMGFWIHMKNDDTLIITGDIPNLTSIQLYKGWNLVGNPSFCIHSIDEIFNSIMGHYTAIQWYDAGDGGDNWKNYHISKPSKYNDLRYITSGRGYWLFVNDDCLWEVNNF
ncbi:MAG: hypothetical protein JSV09_13465 [Thermoplasmata archaeon]|nr:MAG: hypothetical protein JSV09_13465 [Thermoplasmata archaeon]